MVDKNLFPYNLSVVTIMKNEEPYVKEWLDYHLLAGVDHFFIYDNDSKPEFKEILQPYIDAEVVTYIHFPGKCRQMESYIDAFKRFRFLSRYMAWIDADEFIFPKSKSTVPEVVDEIFSEFPNASGLAVNIHAYGSNNLEKADYTRGVLERFTRRASNDYTPDISWSPGTKGGSAAVSSIADPRRVKLFSHPHAPTYFESCYAVGEKGNVVPGFSSYPVSNEKIVMNHYSCKSREEYAKKVQRGMADWADNKYSVDGFSHDNDNDEFDDSILKYLADRQKGGGTENLLQSKRVDYVRFVNILAQNLFPVLVNGTANNFWDVKLENFLTCLNLTSYLKGKFLNDEGAKFFEELSLNAINRSLYAVTTLPEIFLMIDEMPNILNLPYPVVEKIRVRMAEIIRQIMMTFRMNNYWLGFVEMDHNLKFLESFGKINLR